MEELSVKVSFSETDGKNVAIINLPDKFQFLSSAVVNGGFTVSDTVVILQVHKNYSSEKPEEDLFEVYRKLKLKNNAIGFMTASNIKKVLTVSTKKVNNVKAISIATAGTSNAAFAGENPNTQTNDLNNKIGTINIISILNVPLQKTGLTNAVMTITEAKTAALWDHGIEATGTTSDAVAIATPIGDGYKYAGTATDVGIAIAKSVREAVFNSIRKAGDKPCPKDFLTVLGERGISIKDMWEAAKELYVPHPRWDLKVLKKMFIRSLRTLQKDINVNAMILAAALLEEAGVKNKLYGLSAEEFMKDPVHLLTDEILGMALAEYIAGTKGLFEYVRYDTNKPGIIRKLGPFLDDIVASLIGSIMSKIYSKLLEENI
ncbi:MAG: bifunctional adenosylcobinamide hydrolase/alpha-ribazole phosphatase CbiS [Candidatus Baldrarchaeia archaeon]